jgi:hypothetical protein
MRNLSRHRRNGLWALGNGKMRRQRGINGTVTTEREREIEERKNRRKPPFPASLSERAKRRGRDEWKTELHKEQERGKREGREEEREDGSVAVLFLSPSRPTPLHSPFFTRTFRAKGTRMYAAITAIMAPT